MREAISRHFKVLLAIGVLLFWSDKNMGKTPSVISSPAVSHRGVDGSSWHEIATRLGAGLAPSVVHFMPRYNLTDKKNLNQHAAARLGSGECGGRKVEKPVRCQGLTYSASGKALPLDFLSGWHLRPLLSLFNSFFFFHFFEVSWQGSDDLCLMPSQHGAQQMWGMALPPNRGINCGAGCDADTEPRLDAGAKLSQAKGNELTFSHRCHLWAEINVQTVWLETSFNVWELQQWTQAQPDFHCTSCQFHCHQDKTVVCKCRSLQMQNTTEAYCCHPRKKKHGSASLYNMKLGSVSCFKAIVSWNNVIFSHFYKKCMFTLQLYNIKMWKFHVTTWYFHVFTW